MVQRDNPLADITQLLSAVQAGAPQAYGQLFSVLYEELKRIAASQMRAESASHTLQPTALVHEAFLRLIGSANCDWQNRAHFFGAAAEAMRRILIESARAKKAQKRGGENQRVELQDEQVEDEQTTPDEILDLNDAIIQLENEDAGLAQLVKLRFYGGLQMDQIAELQGISKSTAERRWVFAKAWLSHRLGT